jgi:cytochrome c
MSDLTVNKIAGAVLATGLALVGLREISAGVFAPQDVKKPGYLVEVAAEGGEGGAAAEAPIDWGTVLPTADVAAGEAAFNKCKSCHTVDAGAANGTGPNLFGVVGHKPGSHAGYPYSEPMVALGGKIGQWDDAHLSEFLSGPQKYLPGTKMTFVGLKKAEERINLIAFLRTKGASLPVPAPNPAAAAPAADAAATPAAASADEPTATGSTAQPAATSGGPAGQGAGAPAQQHGVGAASPTASGNSRQ